MRGCFLRPRVFLMINEFFRIGVITGTHGIKGEFKVFPTTDDARRYDSLKSAFLETKNGRVEFNVKGVKYFKNMVILATDITSSIDEAMQYKNCDIYVSRENAVPLEEDEHYIADLIGLNVFTDSGENFGTVKDILQTGANDVYVIDADGREYLFPSIPECILDIDIERGFVRVHIMDGLLDL